MVELPARTRHELEALSRTPWLASLLARPKTSVHSLLRRRVLGASGHRKWNVGANTGAVRINGKNNTHAIALQDSCDIFLRFRPAKTGSGLMSKEEVVKVRDKLRRALELVERVLAGSGMRIRMRVGALYVQGMEREPIGSYG